MFSDEQILTGKEFCRLVGIEDRYKEIDSIINGDADTADNRQWLREQIMQGTEDQSRSK